MQRVLVSSSLSRVRVRMSRVRVQMRRTRVRVQQVSSPSPGFCVSSPNPSPEEKNWQALARGIFHNTMNNIIILQSNPLESSVSEALLIIYSKWTMHDVIRD